MLRFSTHSFNLQSPPSTRLPKVSSPLKQPSSTLEPPAHALSTQTNGIQPQPPRTPRPIQSQILSASTTGLPQELASPTLKKKKKKLKRRHSEVEQDAPKASPPEEPKPSTEHRQKKRKKKRKREQEADGLEVQRESVQSHLEPHQDEDWCLGETWSLISEAKGNKIESSKAAENCQTKPQSVPPVGRPAADPVPKKKKKHKHVEQLEELRNGATVSKW